MKRHHLIDRSTEPPKRRCRETPLGQRLQLIPMGWWDGRRHGHDFVTGHDQRTGCGNRGIQLPERTRGRIAWIGKGVVAPFRYAPIQGLEIVEAHIHFASHDKMIRQVGSRV